MNIHTDKSLIQDDSLDDNLEPTLEILYQDEHCIVINKPAGVLVHRSWLAKHETVFVMQTLRNQVGKHVFPVHRLDRATSGALLFAFNSEDATKLTQQFENKTVHKTYIAVVRGYVDGVYDQHNPQTGVIDYALSVIKDKIADKHSRDDKEKQDAVTIWKMLASTEQPFVARERYPTSRYSLVELTPQTGRKHQLRRHMKHIFHPIVGDTSYGDHHQNRAIRTNVGVERMFLHAKCLEFTNIQGERIVVHAPVDEQWQKLMHAFGWSV